MGFSGCCGLLSVVDGSELLLLLLFPENKTKNIQIHVDNIPRFLKQIDEVC